MSSNEIREAALAWFAARCTPIPVAADGSKAPSIPWRMYISRPATATDIERMFPEAKPIHGFGIVCGAGSLGLEMLEAEGRALPYVQRLAALVNDNHPTLWARINNGYVEASPGDGIHWYYRVLGQVALGNRKLARRPATEAELQENPHDKVKTLFETRGQGGYVVAAPSGGPTHPTGKPWRVLTGTPADIPVITADERDLLHACAAMLDEMPTPSLPESPVGTTPFADLGGIRPGDDYNARATWDEILTPRGWFKVKKIGADAYGWVRPGKPAGQGISATTNTRDGADRLYVFSSSTDFEPETPYSKFAAITLLEFNGDYAAAAKHLATQGYGSKPNVVPMPGITALESVDGGAVRITTLPKATQIIANLGQSEEAVASALAETCADELRYCPEQSMWLHWDGHRWRLDVANYHWQVILKIARDLPDSEGWRVFRKAMLSAPGVKHVADLASSDPRLVVHADELDARPYELNTPDGTINLRTGTIHPADPDALHTRTTTVTPVFDWAGTRFERFLTETFPDPALATYMQRLLGLACIGRVLEQVLPFWLGMGANGKTTLAEAVQNALGTGDSGYAATLPSEILMARGDSVRSDYIARLAGVRIVILSELEDDARFAEARVKMLTGGDRLSGRHLYARQFTFTPTHTLMLLGNSRPAATSGGSAFWRRVHLIPFDHVVPESDRDSRLSERLAEEAPAILGWLIQGAVDYLRDGLHTPSRVSVETAEYAHEQDTVARFIEDRCAMVGSIKIGTLRDAYEKWCAENGESSISRNKFGPEVLKRQPSVTKNRSHGYWNFIGIGLAADDEPETRRDLL